MFRGSMVALVTPMKDGKIDLMALRELVELQIDAGTHALVAAGTTGESGTLNQEEKLLVTKTVLEVAKERVPVIAATSANSTRDCIHLTQLAMELGAHAALIMTPAYIKPTQEGLYQHYKHIAEAVAIPIIPYNVPTRTACDLLPETVARLAQISNIIGLKEATGDMARLQETLRSCGTSLDVYSGDDETAVQWMLAGAKGVISVTANLVPRLMAKMCDLALDNDRAACLKLNEQLMSLHRLLFVESNPIPVKFALSKMGLIRNELRLPLTPLTQHYEEELAQALHELSLC